MDDIPVLTNRRILLGVSGSIAAYKAADLCSRLTKLGADVHVVLTKHAGQFVGAATFRALTRNPVLTDLFAEPTAQRIAHIDLAQSADLVLVAPASANILAKMAHGFANDMLTTCLLATPADTPILAAPAMNTVMWEHPATRANVAALAARGVNIIEPGVGLLACQDVGAGKLAEVDTLVAAVVARLTRNHDYQGRRLLITVGATREPLDPVRFLSNRSSGKMGFALAEEAAGRGAQVTVVSGFTTAPCPPNVEIVRVETAEAMLAACLERFPAADAFIAAAAVADYAPVTIAAQKLKKPGPETGRGAGDGSARIESDTGEMVVRLKRNPDIVAAVGAQKRPGQVVVGFAAETEDLLDNAARKLTAKCLDIIVANDVTRAGAGFEGDTNIVTFLWPDGRTSALPVLPKREVARHLLDAVLREFAPPPEVRA